MPLGGLVVVFLQLRPSDEGRGIPLLAFLLRDEGGDVVVIAVAVGFLPGADDCFEVLLAVCGGLDALAGDVREADVEIKICHNVMSFEGCCCSSLL